jgi:hypothetical protein
MGWQNNQESADYTGKAGFVRFLPHLDVSVSRSDA